ncbi:hypothetical protein BaRGS_00023646 [Batillaria attramentaria]|uniref:Uncharacterized protein n=1 Tax=Batillaria attramentaria TaxID=370345 RepID=A0ABD0KDM5_9CAEN
MPKKIIKLVVRDLDIMLTIVCVHQEVVERMSHRVITVDGVECYRFPQLLNDNTLRKQTVNCTQGVLNGTIVRLARDRIAGQSGDNLTINLCEFEVISCSDEYWGNDCSKRCGDCHSGDPCDKVTGYCAVAVPSNITTLRPDRAGAGDNAANTGDDPSIPVIAGSVVGGVVFLVLALKLLVFLIRRRCSSRKKPDEVRVMQRTDVTTDHANPVYENLRDPDSGPISSPDTTASNPRENPAFGMVQGSPQAAYDASNYERLEIYEITNVYTGLNTHAATNTDTE